MKEKNLRKFVGISKYIDTDYIIYHIWWQIETYKSYREAWRYNLKGRTQIYGS